MLNDNLVLLSSNHQKQILILLVFLSLSFVLVSFSIIGVHSEHHQQPNYEKEEHESSLENCNALKEKPELSCESPTDTNQGTCNLNIERDWDTKFDPRIYSKKCTITRVTNPSGEDFQKLVEAEIPVILIDISDNTIFRKMCERSYLLKHHGNQEVVLSSANAHSYDRVHWRLSKYIYTNMKEQTLDVAADKTWYQFGDNYLEGWEQFLKNYNRPPYLNSDKIGSISWGMGGSGSGVPFHTHGAVFAEVLHGKKRWFLYPAETERVDIPNYHPNQTSLFWTIKNYPFFEEEKKPIECVLGPGEVLYIPNNWWHSTLNIGESVFISVFI